MRLALCLAAALLTACSAEQAYHSAQGWQQNQCMAIADKVEYDRCMSRPGTSYESYKKETEQKR
jgi:uncharacterized membrane protein